MTKKIDEGKKSVKKVHKKFLVLSKVDRTIPPDANKELRKSRTMFGKSVPLEKTLDDARSYIDSVKEAFHDEPAKYAEFLKLLNDYKARRYGLFSPCTFDFLLISCLNLHNKHTCELILMLLISL